MNWNTFYQENHTVIIGGTFTLLGVVIGWLLNLCQSYFTNKRADSVHIRDKREEIYEQMYDFIMRYEKDARTYKSNKYISEDTRDFYNALEPKTIWATVKIREQFYTLFEDIMENAKSYKKHWEKTSDKNRKKILDFKEQIRKELGLKD